MQKPSELNFRENRQTGKIEVCDGDTVLFSHYEYRMAAEWAQARFKLYDHELMTLFSALKTV